jgi:predicted aconitase with swiveling domain
MICVPSKVLLPGKAAVAQALVLTAPISFWGGVNPKTGVIADIRHPQHGLGVAGRMMFVPGTIGSSSAAAVLLELVHAGLAPAGLVLHEPDAILLLGLIVAKEMGLVTPLAVQLDREQQAQWTGCRVGLSADGVLSALPGA